MYLVVNKFTSVETTKCKTKNCEKSEMVCFKFVLFDKNQEVIYVSNDFVIFKII